VTTLAKISNRRAGRSMSDDAPVSARCRVARRADDRQVDRRRDQRRNPRSHTEPKGEIEDIAKTEQKREADDRPHDHGDRPDDSGRRLAHKSCLGWPSGVTTGLSTWKLPSITSMPLENRWSEAGPSACSPAGGTQLIKRFRRSAPHPTVATYRYGWKVPDQRAQVRTIQGTGPRRSARRASCNPHRPRAVGAAPQDTGSSVWRLRCDPRQPRRASAA